MLFAGRLRNPEQRSPFFGASRRERQPADRTRRLSIEEEHARAVMASGRDKGRLGSAETETGESANRQDMDVAADERSGQR